VLFPHFIAFDPLFPGDGIEGGAHRSGHHFRERDGI
jgi:hypothetical protein